MTILYNILRDRRRSETAQMTKCSCGNVARHGTSMCGRCQEDNDRAAKERQVAEDRYLSLDDCSTVEELKQFIRIHLLT